MDSSCSCVFVAEDPVYAYKICFFQCNVFKNCRNVGCLISGTYVRLCFFFSFSTKLKTRILDSCETRYVFAELCSPDNYRRFSVPLLLCLVFSI